MCDFSYDVNKVFIAFTWLITRQTALLEIAGKALQCALKAQF
jgi:hypothetical protein